MSLSWYLGMNIFLAGLSGDVTEGQLREMLVRYVELEQVELLPGNHPEQTIAMLTVKASNAEAHWAANRLTGLYWRGHSLQAYVSLF